MTRETGLGSVVEKEPFVAAHALAEPLTVPVLS